MESKGWVYQLPKGAEGLHESMQGAGLGLGLGLGVDVMVEKEVQVKVESGVKMERVSKGEGEKKGKVGDRILDGKPFAREVFAVCPDIKVDHKLIDAGASLISNLM